ncbi:MAG: hypothetical protein EWV75_16500 [Microcystis wesenbergii Mw_QC_S_20081001_S30D]|uniref:Uncharacterized protein n=1 Tax=Microcystis wesenbergii Mw_QC_S_20081001_S30D TaxID=2486245 RepID=A0A552JF46_9CHRO|nr:hypothetical protein [Microcystis aeruginosa W11-03]NCR94532.1 hypothetical protein [Microcystis aeruginosa W11-06]TRU94114.1 MAG: hypothetical protein EWV75_16500 [Microcystis wesenbergii Mw_QC_S_20081001_S30D]TRU96794.1 MAG: hypothetical protein EWV73_18035 [Microcystis wesenbergii Mw_QC_B_20070930_S4D]TRV04558.1 MAG: hypothetical protein EWV74_04620 [Microcystis wesenbergii Mw_QC_S_20081001_S30]TRV12111.1 MAG: hypothetical protein EWV89_13755 [Microcystis wesenbergii Mw_QC_B_20070930_S4]
MRSIAIQQKQTIIYPRMPLAIYRELASHLQQVQGVETHLTPQQFQQFDYHQSQIGSLEINYSEAFQESDRTLVTAILDYYAQDHGLYQLS